MVIPYYPLKFDSFYDEFKNFCIEHWLDYTINSSKAINVKNLNPEEYYHSAIFCVENNIAPTVIDLVGQQRQRTWSTNLLIGVDQQKDWGQDFQSYLDSIEGGNKMVAPYAILVPLSGSVTVNFKYYPTNVINDRSFYFDPNLIGDTLLSIELTQPYLVPSIYPVDIITKESAGLYVIYRFICPTHKILDKWIVYTLHNFKARRLLQ